MRFDGLERGGSMGSLRRQFGFWHALGHMRLRDLTAPEILFGVIIGSIGTYLMVRFGQLPQRQSTAGDFLAISASLAGIVFAGFALVIGLLSDHYLRWLESTDSGVSGFLSPFLVSTGFQVGAVLASIAYRAASASLPHVAEHWAFGITCILFTTALLDIVALARSVLMHGVARGRSLSVRDLDHERGRRGQA
jgi:hypothetical protein